MIANTHRMYMQAPAARSRGSEMKMMKSRATVAAREATRRPRGRWTHAHTQTEAKAVLSFLPMSRIIRGNVHRVDESPRYPF